MDKTIEDIKNEINELSIRNATLNNERLDIDIKLTKLKNELKKLQEESYTDWYKDNPIQVYYKKTKDDPENRYFQEEYIKIDDEKCDEYNRNIREMAESQVELNIERFEFFYVRQRKLKSVQYQDSTKVATWQFVHKKDNEPGQYGIWTLIPKAEFDAAKKKAIDYINNTNH